MDDFFAMKTLDEKCPLNLSELAVEEPEVLECMNKRNRLARKKKRKRMGERISLRYR